MCIRSSIKIILLIVISIFIIIGIIACVYRPMYDVYINGTEVGFTKHKSELQQKITEYIHDYVDEQGNTWYPDLNNLDIDYKLCLLQSAETISDDVILSKVDDYGKANKKIKYFKLQVCDKEYILQKEEDVIQLCLWLKEKNYNNLDSITYTSITADDVNPSEVKSLDNVKVAISIEPTSSFAIASTSRHEESGLDSFDMNFGNPIEGATIKDFSSGYGYRILNGRKEFHDGLDIAKPKGTPIYAAASGIVEYAAFGYPGSGYGGFGNVVKINHGYNTSGKEVKTIYGHCSKLAVSKGQYVNKGDIVGYVGSTGKSTGNHCHFGIYINGKTVNPRLYVY